MVAIAPVFIARVMVVVLIAMAVIAMMMLMLARMAIVAVVMLVLGSVTVIAVMMFVLIRVSIGTVMMLVVVGVLAVCNRTGLPCNAERAGEHDREQHPGKLLHDRDLPSCTVASGV